MNIYRLKPKRDTFIVYKKGFRKIEGLADLNENKIKELAEAKFKKYIHDGIASIKLEFRIRGVNELVGHYVISELNYRERDYPVFLC